MPGYYPRKPDAKYSSLSRWGDASHHEDWDHKDDWRENKEAFVAEDYLDWSILVDNKTGDIVRRYSKVGGFY